MQHQIDCCSHHYQMKIYRKPKYMINTSHRWWRGQDSLASSESDSLKKRLWKGIYILTDSEKVQYFYYRYGSNINIWKYEHFCICCTVLLEAVEIDVTKYTKQVKYKIKYQIFVSRNWPISLKMSQCTIKMVITDILSVPEEIKQGFLKCKILRNLENWH